MILHWPAELSNSDFLGCNNCAAALASSWWVSATWRQFRADLRQVGQLSHLIQESWKAFGNSSCRASQNWALPQAQNTNYTMTSDSLLHCGAGHKWETSPHHTNVFCHTAFWREGIAPHQNALLLLSHDQRSQGSFSSSVCVALEGFEGRSTMVPLKLRCNFRKKVWIPDERILQTHSG